MFPSFANVATLLIESLHIQFQKPSVSQTGKRGKTLLMRKGNLVPPQLPAARHCDLGRRLNPAPPCCSGSPAISHAPGSWQSWHPGGGRRPRLPPLPAREASASALPRSFPGPARREGPRGVFFPPLGCTSQPAQPEPRRCVVPSLPNLRVQQLRRQQTPKGWKMNSSPQRWEVVAELNAFLVALSRGLDWNSGWRL